MQERMKEQERYTFDEESKHLRRKVATTGGTYVK